MNKNKKQIKNKYTEKTPNSASGQMFHGGQCSTLPPHPPPTFLSQPHTLYTVFNCM
jgi:hypothetical protein